MNTKKLLDGLRESIFGSMYVKSLEDAYAEEVDQGIFDIQESDYRQAVPYLDKHLTQEQKEILNGIEADYGQMRIYAGEYPFYCGLMCAFEQFFIPEGKQSYDYDAAVQGGMCTMPAMTRHVSYFEANQRILEQSEALMEAVDKDTREHIVSINCAWEQRIHSQTIYAFYLGYRAGLEIMDRVRPMSSYALTSKKLYLEYQLGFTTPYEFRERRSAQKEVS